MCLFVSGRRTFASTSARGADITLTVDGKEVTVPQGSFLGFVLSMGYETEFWIFSILGSALIQACEAAGATIPRYAVISEKFPYL